MSRKSGAGNAASVVFFSLNFVDGALPWLRIRGPAQSLGWQVIPGNDWTRVQPELVAQADLVMVQRDFPRLEAEFSRILQLAAEQGKPVVLDIDDLLLDLPAHHPDRQQNYYASALVPVLRALRQVDLVTTSTPRLAEILRPWQPDIEVLPNLLDEQIWLPELSAQHSPAASFNAIPERSGQIGIGFWGGAAHAPDLAQVAPALARVLQHSPLVHLNIWGPELPPALQDHPRVFREPLEIYRYSEYAGYCRQQRLARGIDLVIVPLEDNLFNRCKSGVKFLENSALGLPGVYSHLDPYAGLVVHGENGLLADSLESWETALNTLVQDTALRQRLGSQARQLVLTEWTMAAHAERWQQMYQHARQRAAGRAQFTESLAGPGEADLLYRLAEQLHQAYANGKRSVLDGPADSNPAARLWQVEKELQTAQSSLAEIQHSRAWRLVQQFRRLRAAIRWPQK